MMRHATCILLVVVGGGFFFGCDLLDDYLALGRNRDSFYPDLLLFLILLIAVVVALVQSTYAILRRPVNWQRIICRVLFVVCVVASFWFQRVIASFEDGLFFRAQEANFKNKLLPRNPDATIVHIRSSVNFHRLIIFSGAHLVAEGALSLSALDALGAELSGLRGCAMTAKPLWDGFYVLRAYC
jgi:hypothetical protein